MTNYSALNFNKETSLQEINVEADSPGGRTTTVTCALISKLLDRWMFYT